MKRSMANYWVDMFIAAALVVSAVSGVVFLLPAGRATALGVSYRTWDTVHTWSSLAMIGAAGMHLLLHWKWLVTMTRRMVMPTHVAQARGADTNAGVITRRRFLRLGLSAAAVATIAAAYSAASQLGATEGDSGAFGLASETGAADGNSGAQPRTGVGALPPEQNADSPSEQASQGSSHPEEAPSSAEDAPLGQDDPSPTTAGVDESDIVVAEKDQADSKPAQTEEPPQQEDLEVACPFGLVNDPFPGRCRRYTDKNQDGICDYSVLGSGSNPIGA